MPVAGRAAERRPEHHGRPPHRRADGERGPARPGARSAGRLAVRLDASELRIEVTDARGDKWPTPRHPDGDRGESGRGLLLVETLADDWGVHPHHPGGKTVWAVCRR
ncbi:ATP-binding protein [Streptomyces sp. NPDC059076]|uniref:ATP-binding protein n=1 Tax=unclassified Streptomyces TaxID=2593676 RepID=UPI00367F5238